MTRRFPIERFAAGRRVVVEDELSVEEPLLVKINGKPLATLMRTPGDDVALVTGFLYSEGLIARPGDIASIIPTEHPTSQEMDVQLSGGMPGPTAARSIYLSSSCGVCGRASIDELLERIEPIERFDVDPELLLTLPAKLTGAQRQFPLTGGVHAAALFAADGNLISIEEDVGRHNALDKLVGKAFAGSTLPLTGTILVMSSRGSFDIVQKAAMAGIPVVATMGAASSLAAQLALASGIRLFCFLKANVFCLS